MGWTTGVRLAAGRNLSLRHRVPTGSGIHPAFYLMDTGALPPGIKQPRHEDICGSGSIAPRILNPGTRWRSVVSFIPLTALPTPGERAPCSHLIGGWVGPRVVLDAVAKKTKPFTLSAIHPTST